jgi:hypothetical protein
LSYGDSGRIGFVVDGIQSVVLASVAREEYPATDRVEEERMKGADKQKKGQKKVAQKTLKEKRSEKKAKAQKR